MTTKTFEEYITDCANIARKETDWRAGQVYFNVLVEHRPDLAERARNTSVDPFYRNERIPAFLDFVVTNWPADDSGSSR